MASQPAYVQAGFVLNGTWTIAQRPDSQEHFGNCARRRLVLSDSNNGSALNGFCRWLVSCALRVLEVFESCQVGKQCACTDDLVQELI